MADELAKQGLDSQFMSPEQLCCMSYCALNIESKQLEQQKMMTNRMVTTGGDQFKRFLVSNITIT